jgi:hypothetical protein
MTSLYGFCILDKSIAEKITIAHNIMSHTQS